MSEEPELLNEVSDLYLFLSIIFLALFFRFLTTQFWDFSSALFACISVPATYALVYYRRRARPRRFVEPKKPSIVELGRTWLYELVAVLASYATAYLIFVASTGNMDLFLFSLAFFTAQALRISALLAVRIIRALKMDPSNPAVMLVTSFMIAFTFFSAINTLLLS